MLRVGVISFTNATHFLTHMDRVTFGIIITCTNKVTDVKSFVSEVCVVRVKHGVSICDWWDIYKSTYSVLLLHFGTSPSPYSSPMFRH